MVEIIAGGGGKPGGGGGNHEQGVLRQAWDRLLKSNGTPADIANFENEVGGFSPAMAGLFRSRSGGRPRGAGNVTNSTVQTPAFGGPGKISIQNNITGLERIESTLKQILDALKGGGRGGISAIPPESKWNLVASTPEEREHIVAGIPMMRMRQRSRRNEQIMVAREQRQEAARRRHHGRLLTAPIRFLGSPGAVASEIIGGGMFGGAMGSLLAVGGASALEAGLIGLAAGRPYAEFMANAGFYGGGAGFGPSFKNTIFPGYGAPPGQWANVGIGQAGGLDILRSYPRLARSTAGAMGLVQNIGLGRFLPGMGQYSPTSLAHMAALGPQFGFFNRGTGASIQARDILQQLSHVMVASQRSGLPLSGVRSAIEAYAGAAAGAGASLTSLAPAVNAVSPFFQHGIGSAEASYMAGALTGGVSSASRTAMGSPLQVMRLQYDLARSAPGKALEHMLGPTAYAAMMRQNPKLMQLYASLYNSNNPNDRAIATYVLGQIQSSAVYLSGNKNAFIQRNFGAFATRYSGLSGAATQVAIGNLTGGLIPYTLGTGSLGPLYGSAGGVGATGAYSPSFAAALGLFSGTASDARMEALLHREGVSNPALRKAIMATAKKSGVSAAMLGEIAYRESSGGANSLPNVMHMTSGALAAIHAKAPTTMSQSVSDAASYIKYLDRQYAKTHGGRLPTQEQLFHMYGPHKIIPHPLYGPHGHASFGYAFSSMTDMNRAISAVTHLNQHERARLRGYAGENVVTFGPRGEAVGYEGSEMGFMAGEMFERGVSLFSNAVHSFVGAVNRMSAKTPGALFRP